MSLASSVMVEEDFTSMESAYGGSSVNSACNNDMGLMMKLQAALKEAHREKEQLEKKVEELEGSSSPQQSSDLLKLQDLEIENVKLREDMAKLRRSIVDTGEGDNEAVREMADQYELLQEEHDRVRAECLQLRAVLANVQLSGAVEIGRAHV